jgi:hypothetical protein
MRVVIVTDDTNPTHAVFIRLDATKIGPSPVHLGFDTEQTKVARLLHVCLQSCLFGPPSVQMLHSGAPH